MRCSCKKCGTYMVQTERGLMSGCQCPDCGEICRDCMGSVEAPISRDELKDRLEVLIVERDDANTVNEERQYYNYEEK